MLSYFNLSVTLISLLVKWSLLDNVPMLRSKEVNQHYCYFQTHYLFLLLHSYLKVVLRYLSFHDILGERELLRRYPTFNQFSSANFLDPLKKFLTFVVQWSYSNVYRITLDRTVCLVYPALSLCQTIIVQIFWVIVSFGQIFHFCGIFEDFIYFKNTVCKATWLLHYFSSGEEKFCHDSITSVLHREHVLGTFNLWYSNFYNYSYLKLYLSINMTIVNVFLVFLFVFFYYYVILPFNLWSFECP